MNLARCPTAVLTLVSVALFGCGDAGQRSGIRAALQKHVVTEDLMRLDDAGQPVLARPERLSVDGAGRVLISDFSDKNIKVYAANGTRAATVGRPGRGPGEFASLLGAEAYRDSVIGYDLAERRLTVFGPDGRYARSLVLDRLPFTTFTVRVVDDSLFLAVAAAVGIGNHPALALLRPDGSVLSTFFTPGTYVGSNPQVLQTIFVMADAADGVVFVGLAGGDSLWTFDYHGKPLGSAPIDPRRPIRSSRSVIEANGGRVQRPDGSIVLDGQPTLMGIVALDSGTVAMQIAPRDLTNGMDLLDGGTVIVSATRPHAPPAVIARAALTGALLGRDRRGAPLVLRYHGDQDHYAIARLRLAAEPPRSSP